MPRASRRRRRPPGRGVGQTFLVAVAAGVTIVLVAGSLLAIHTQSAGYRGATTDGYLALANRIGESSAATGAGLASLMDDAATLPAGVAPDTARGVLQHGLDSAVAAASAEAAQAVTIASPPPVAGIAAKFTEIMDLRSATTLGMRTTLDQLLGMQPLPVAGSPSTPTPAAPATLISADSAASQMAAAGRAFLRSDASFASLQATVNSQHGSVRLRPSVWVPAPVATAPLGPDPLGSTAIELASSPSMLAVHHVVVTAVGLQPPAVPSGNVGVVATSCSDPQTAAPDATPTVLPPTNTLSASVSVTNCGNVPESDATVSITVVPAPTPGTDLPAAGRRGGRRSVITDIAAGRSVAPDLAAVPVASGNRYTVTVAVSVPPGQTDPAGTTQQFLVYVSP